MTSKQSSKTTTKPSPSLSQERSLIPDQFARNTTSPVSLSKDFERATAPTQYGGSLVDAILAEPGSRYGQFHNHADIAQSLRDLLRHDNGDTNLKPRLGWERLTNDKRQALDTIMDKIARILNGDPEYLDNWDDICGYSKLVADRIRELNQEGYPGSPQSPR